MDATVTAATADDVIGYWFGTDPGTTTGRKIWFTSDAALDREIEQRFGNLVVAAAAGKLTHWSENAVGRLALIVALDQFTRNIHRGQATAFDNDKRALALTIGGMADGLDREVPPLHRVFFYMPLQHSEELKVQEASIRVFDELAKESADDELRKTLNGFAEFAHLHHGIVARFGRFPHRNAVLGRRSTPEEDQYLADGGPKFGQ